MTTEAITPLRQRMIEDMNARKLCAGTQRAHISSCKRFAAFLKRSPDTATLEDIFRDHGAAWRSAHAGHVSLEQLKVMSAIERCRTAALGGHVARCEGCAHTLVSIASATTDCSPRPTGPPMSPEPASSWPCRSVRMRPRHRRSQQPRTDVCCRSLALAAVAA